MRRVLRIPMHIAEPLIYYCNLVVQIQRRLAAILISLPNRCKNKQDKPEPVPRVKLDHLLSNTSHCVSRSSNRLTCNKCLSSFSVLDPATKHWLQAPCISPTEESSAVGEQLTHQHVVINEPCHIGNQLTHSSHKLYKYRGLIYCNKCGARSGANQVRYLAKQCMPPTDGGEYALKRILSGKLPPRLSAWPG